MLKLFYFAFLFFLALYAFVFLRSLFSKYFRKPVSGLNIYFGIPGSGKTTYAAYIAKVSSRASLSYKIEQKYSENAIVKFLFRNAKAPLTVYSNVPILGTYKIDPLRDLGFYMICDGVGIIDESGIDYNNRRSKTMPPENVEYLKLYRHFGMSFHIFSQSHEDMDITFRRLASRYFLVKKSLFPYFIVVKRIHRKVGIDENTHQIADLFNFGLPFLDDQYIFMPTLWKMFDSYDVPVLPTKKFERWDRTSAAEPVPVADPDTGEVADQSTDAPEQSDPFSVSSSW